MFPESKVTPRLFTSSVGLGGKFLHVGFSGLSVTNDDEFYSLWVKFQLHTIHPILNTS